VVKIYVPIVAFCPRCAFLFHTVLIKKNWLFACTTVTVRSKQRTRSVLFVVGAAFLYVNFRWTSVFRELIVMWYMVGIQRRGICMMTVCLQFSMSLILKFQTPHHSKLGHTNNSRIGAPLCSQFPIMWNVSVSEVRLTCPRSRPELVKRLNLQIRTEVKCC
jgi:hypothetical protein